MPLTVPSRVAGEPSQSSAGSGIFFQGDGHSQSIIHSQLSSAMGNSANSICGIGRSNINLVSGNVNNAVLNSVGNSGPNVGASSLVTDANSAFSGGPRLQRSASINAESYSRFPASPMSFSSNNISGSCSSVIDEPPMTQKGSNRDLNPQQVIQSQFPLSTGPRVSPSLLEDHAHQQKKPRLDLKQEDILQQHVLQLLQRQDPMQLQSHNPQLQFILQQQRLRQHQQQILHAMPQIQREHLQQQQLRQHMQQQNVHQTAVVKNPYDTGGVCARRLMQYLYHQRQRPSENSITYWRKFVAEYFAPRAKKRWCLSLYENVGNHALGVFPQAAMDAWHCDICGSKSGRGFEATYEVLPRLNEIKFGSGVIDELLFLDWPRERRFVNGIMVLEYGKAVQESVYEQLRVVREGQLRIIFTQDLKILSWEFCARRHEELLPRRLIAPQVNQLLQVAQECQSTVADSGPEGISSQNLLMTSNMVVTASRQLAKSLELQSLNDLGFSKRYVRCLQIAEVVNSMKDLIDFCRNSEVGPIEGLKSYLRHGSMSLNMQRIQEQPGINTRVMGNIHNMNPTAIDSRGSFSISSPAALPLTNYQNVMMRQNSINSNPNSHHLHEASSYLNNNPNQSPTSSFRGYMAAGQQKMMSGGQNVNSNPTASGVGYGNLEHPSTPALSSNVSGGGPTLSKNSSFKAEPSNSESSQKTPYLPPRVDDTVSDLPHDFAENLFFGSDIDDNLGFGWNA